MSYQTRSSSFISDIQIIRGISILVGLYAHLGYLLVWEASRFQSINRMYGFWSVIDLFFVVSGFIISKDLFLRLQNVQTTELFWRNIIGFWIRRAWRILPAAWLWLLVTLIGSILFNRSAIWGTVHGNFDDIIAVLLQVKNLHNYSCHQLEAGLCGANSHYWSVALEDQFYFIFPIFFLFFRKHLVPALLTLIVIQWIFMPIDGQSVFTYIRVIPFILGVLLASFYSTPTYFLFEPVFLKKFTYGRLIFTGILFFCLISVAGASALVLSGSLRVNLVFIIAALIVLIASYNQNYLIPEGAFRNFVLYFGARSFSIYLVHVPAFHFTIELWSRLSPPDKQFTSDYSVCFLLTAIPIIALLTEINYRWIEVPTRKKGAQIAERYLSKSHSLSEKEQHLWIPSLNMNSKS